MDEQSDDADQRDDEFIGSHEATPAFRIAALERDRVYESLAHVRRRYLCYLLCERSELQVDDAVAAIADWEWDDEDPPESHREQIRISLLHSHIPKLRANDVVEFDPHDETLVTDDAEAVMAALTAVGTALCPESSIDAEEDVA